MQLYAGEGIYLSCPCLFVQSDGCQGNVDGLKELLKQGVNVDDKDEEGRTGFQFACGYGEIECIKFFLENGADINCADNNKNTAMHYAAGYGQQEAVKILLERSFILSYPSVLSTPLCC